MLLLQPESVWVGASHRVQALSPWRCKQENTARTEEMDIIIRGDGFPL